MKQQQREEFAKTIHADLKYAELEALDVFLNSEPNYGEIRPAFYDAWGLWAQHAQ